ncbi:MAG: response regulator [Lewinellaceae bacterium]|nr:response regulator [Lewinellaceae bacterium]
MAARQPKPIPAGEWQMKEGALFDIQYLDVKQGLSGPFVLSLLKDSRGHIWLGYFGGGVSRYDGNTLATYTQEEGLAGTTVRAMVEDGQGHLWFGTMNGVSRYDGNVFTNYSLQEGSGGNVVWAIFKDSRGNIWIGTDHGVARYESDTEGGEESFTWYTIKEGLPSNAIRSIAEDSRGHLWFGTDGGGVCRFDRQRFTHYTMEQGLASDKVWSILEDSRGRLWFGTDGGGVCRFDGGYEEGGSFVQYTTAEGLSGNLILSILEDSRGHLWFGTRGGGATSLDFESGEEIFRHFSTREGLSNSSVWCMLDDEDNGLWFGTWEGGINRYLYQSFVRYTARTGLSHQDIKAIFEDSRGKLWFGTWGGGVNQYDPAAFAGRGGFTNFSTANGLSNDFISTIFEDSQGHLWFGTIGGGVLRYDGKSFVNYTVKEGLSDDSIWCILEDRQGNFWFGTGWNGLTRFEPSDDHLNGQFTHFTIEQGLISNYVWSALEDSRGKLWFGTWGGGVFRYDPPGEGRMEGLFTHYTIHEGLCSNHVNFIFEDSQEKLWFGTSGGLTRYDLHTEEIRGFTQKEGLKDNLTLSFLEDGRNNLWIESKNEIQVLSSLQAETLLKADQKEENRPVFSFGKGDILSRTNPDPNNNNVLIDRQNRIWWGAKDGAAALDLRHFHPSSKPPENLTLSHLEVGREFVDFRQLRDPAYRRNFSFGEALSSSFDTVAPFTNYPTNLSLSHKINHLAFHFSAVDWDATRRLRYSYFLEGLDETWSIPQTESKAEYRNLPYGKFTFKVKAMGDAQIWSEPFAYRFVIRPPWWFSWWAYSLYVIALLLLLGAFYLYQRRRWILQARLQVQQERADHLMELDRFKTRFYTNITHEFRTPLTVINGLADQIAEQEKIGAPIRRNADRLMNMVNQLLELSKLESNSLAIDWVQTDVFSYLQYLTESCHSLAENKKLNLAFFAKEDKLVMDIDENKLQQILINLLTNAIKFTPEYGTVKVIASQVLREGDPFLELKIQDTGIGISPDKLSHIFDRFYQVDGAYLAAIERSRTNTRPDGGAGIGLALAKELAELLGGRIEVQSELGKGTTFKVLLPVHRDAPAKTTVDSAFRFTPAIPLPAASDELMASDNSGNDGKPQVLIIEDNADLIEYIASYLRPEFDIQAARNGRDGLSKALELVPDVVLCDVMMPEMDGFEVCRRLKSDRRTSHVPVIILTAKVARKDKIAGLSQGADAYLTKPFDKEELLVRIHNLVVRSKYLRDRLTNPFTTGDQSGELERRESAFLEELRQIIESNMANDLFDTNHLCRALAMSRAQLHRKLKALTGQPTAAFIRSFRLKKAKSLLETTSLPVGEISVRVGYKDFSHFSRSFFNEFGAKPHETRK